LTLILTNITIASCRCQALRFADRVQCAESGGAFRYVGQRIL